MSIIKPTKIFKRTFGSCLSLCLGLLSTSCGNNSPITSNKTVSLQGSGTSFPAPLYQRWIQEYSDNYNNITIDYESINSGIGIQDFMAENVDFGATDAPLTTEERARYPEDRGQAIQIPMTGGLLVFAYNLSDYEDSQNIRLSRQTYCGIVKGEITNWNDPAIIADNPDARLPNLPLIFVHRDDSSGTTFLFANHLQEVCDNWELGASKVVEWPVGIGADGNEGISALIQQTQGTIGYLQYSYAENENIQVATLENQAGNFIKPSSESASRAFTIDQIPEDLVILIPDPQDTNAYPIVGLTWLLVYSRYDEEPDKARVMRDFVEWSLTQGDEIASELGYFPLPDQLQTRVLNTIQNNLEQ